LPRSALNEIKHLAETDAPAAFKKLQAVMEEYGISQSLLEAQTKTTAVAYDKLGGAAADAFAQIGQGLATTLKPVAEYLTVKLQEVANGIEQLNKAGDKKMAFQMRMIEASTTLDQFNSHVQNANNQISTVFDTFNLGAYGAIPGINLLAQAMSLATEHGLKFDEITAAQFQLAKSLQTSGASAEVVTAALNRTQERAAFLDRQYKSLDQSLNITKAQYNEFVQVLLQAELTSQDAAIAADALFREVLENGMTISEAQGILQNYLGALEQIEIQKNRVTDATGQATSAEEKFNQELTIAATDAATAAAQSELLKLRQEEIYEAALAAARGLDGSGNAGLAMAKKFNMAEDRAWNLIHALQALELQKSKVITSSTIVSREPGSRRGGPDELMGIGINPKNLDIAAERVDKINEALRDQAWASANAKQQLAMLNAELSRLTPGTVDYIKKQTEINRLTEQMRKDAERDAKQGAKGAKLTDNEKLNDKLIEQEIKYQQQMEDLEKSHTQKLLDIYKDYAKKQLEAQKENDISKRRSRASFYTDLSKSDLSEAQKQQFSSEYEAAFAEAQKIAQEGHHKLSAEFLKMKQDHLAEMRALAEEEAEIRNSEMGKGDKAAALAMLEGRRKLVEDAQREELKQLMEGGDAIEQEYKDRLEAEYDAYAEQADKIAETAGRAADAKIRAAQNNKIAIDQENLALSEQLRLYSALAGEKPVPTIPSVPTQPVEPAEPIPVRTDTPLPVQTPEALLVKQFEMFLVRDQGVIDAIGDQTSRLEGKLTELQERVVGAVDVLGARITDVRNAVLSTRSGKAVNP
jgi:hypothetical protein